MPKKLPEWCCTKLEEKLSELEEIPYTQKIPEKERGLYVSLGMLQHLGYDMSSYYHRVEQINLERMKKNLDF